MAAAATASAAKFGARRRAVRAKGDARFGASIPLDATRRVIPSTRTRWRGFIRIRWRSSSTSSRLWGITGFRIRCAKPLASSASGGVPMEGLPARPRRRSTASRGTARRLRTGTARVPGTRLSTRTASTAWTLRRAMYAMQMQAQMQAHMMGMGVGVGAGMGEGPHDHGAEGRGGVGLSREGPGESPIGAGAWMPREQMAQFQQFQQEMMNARGAARGRVRRRAERAAMSARAIAARVPGRRTPRRRVRANSRAAEAAARPRKRRPPARSRQP